MRGTQEIRHDSVTPVFASAKIGGEARGKGKNKKAVEQRQQANRALPPSNWTQAALSPSGCAQASQQSALSDVVEMTSISLGPIRTDHGYAGLDARSY